MFLSVITLSILWSVVKKTFQDEVKDLQFFLTFIGVIVPFVMVVYFGLTIIYCNKVAARSGWPPVLPLNPTGLLPLIVGTRAFYIGQTVWLWLGWRKL